MDPQTFFQAVQALCACGGLLVMLRSQRARKVKVTRRLVLAEREGLKAV